MLRTCLITQLLFIMLLNLGVLHVHRGIVIGCHEAEREALLKFKQSLSDPTNGLSSWEGKDCCDWEGVGCDNVTAFVNRLHLPNPHTVDLSSPRYLTAPKLDSSLRYLSQLSHLDLSGNDFQSSPIPEFIGSFKYMRYLNLSYSNFSGVVPSQLGNLTRLQTLDLSSNHESAGYLSSDLHWVSRLVSLQYLNFDCNNNSMHAVNMPSSLVSLHLSGCGSFSNPLLLTLFSNSAWFSSIQHLDLSFNFFGGTLPYVLANMTSLTYLDLAGNELNSSIPLWLGNMTSLTYLDLSENQLEYGSILPSMRNLRNLKYLNLRFNTDSPAEGGVVMDLLVNLCKLVTIDLSINSISGSLQADHHNSSKCVSYDLENLNLGGNMIQGMLPSWLGDFKNLRVLDISDNRINGRIPVSIGRLSYLEQLDLSHNTLNGTIPQGLGQCKALVHIDLSSNFLHSVLSESHLGNLSRLEYLDLSFNVVEWNISSNWSPPFQLTLLQMTSCKIQSQFPQWIAEQTKLVTLDFSDNNMSGELPQCFTSNQLNYINISHSQITGPVPYFSSAKLKFIDLSYNLLSGSLVHHDPSAKNDTAGTPICQLYGLWHLDLQKNNISGGISDCWVGSESNRSKSDNIVRYYPIPYYSHIFTIILSIAWAISCIY